MTTAPERPRLLSDFTAEERAEIARAADALRAAFADMSDED